MEVEPLGMVFGLGVETQARSAAASVVKALAAAAAAVEAGAAVPSPRLTGADFEGSAAAEREET